MAAGVGAIAIAVAKWAVGIGATVVATDLLNNYYQGNKGKIGKTFDKWVTELGELWQKNYDRDIGSAKVELLDQPNNEITRVTDDKEQTSEVQSSYNYTKFVDWLKSAEGQKYLTETAPKVRAEGIADGNIEVNPGKQEQIDSIQGNKDAGTYQQSYDSTLAAKSKLTANPGMFEFSEDQTIGEKLPGGENEEKYDEKTGQGFDTPSEGIQDKTDENLGTNNVQAMDWMKWAEEEQAKRWARDDAIMYATWEREDTAWQRGVEDMRKAGVNPNLVGAQPAASGGGITQSSGQNLSGVTTQMNIDLDKMQQIIDQAFKGDENDKDRFMDLFGNIIQWIAIIGALKGKK